MTKISLRSAEILALALGGAIYSGYLSYSKLVLGTCVLGVPCPLFLGYPACYFGFAMFFVLAVLAFVLVARPDKRSALINWVVGIAALGTVFALYFTSTEWPAIVSLMQEFSIYAIPSCVVGLIIYLAALYLSLVVRAGLKGKGW